MKQNVLAAKQRRGYHCKMSSPDNRSQAQETGRGAVPATRYMKRNLPDNQEQET